MPPKKHLAPLRKPVLTHPIQNFFAPVVLSEAEKRIRSELDLYFIFLYSLYFHFKFLDGVDDMMSNSCMSAVQFDDNIVIRSLYFLGASALLNTVLTNCTLVSSKL